MRLIIIILLVVIPMLSAPTKTNACLDSKPIPSLTATPEPTATNDLGQIL